MKGSLGVKSFPPGVRFQPTNEELVMYYLKRKVLGKSLSRPQMISELDVYKFEPWDLPEMACLKTKDRYWYFFCPRSKKYPSGNRSNRVANKGYWKSTGVDKEVKYKERCVGKIKHLVFHSGKSPNGARTNWVMHEYVLNDTLLADKGVPQDSYAICKIFEKSGAGPKNGEEYGARFVEEEWDSDTDDNVQERTPGLVSCDMSFGTPAVMGTPNIAATTSNTSTVMGIPYTAATTSSTTTAVMSVPYLAAPTSSTTTSTGTPYISATTPLDVPIAAPLSLDVSEEDEVDRLLQHFTDDAEDFEDIFQGLEDLDNSFIEMNDLIRHTKN
uniref:NAC domain-containing protein n=1 Tax=Chenopodium quinoa TaxID=63459 RepID=A0A803KN86_CHEQI